MNDIVIRGVTAVLEDGVRRADIGIDGERIAQVAAAGSLPKGKRDIDAADLVALPGMIDMHSHHREPGFTHKEDLASMAPQCAAGGVTTSVAMPNVSPPPTTAENLDAMIDIYKRKAAFDWNVNASGVQLDEIPKLAERGILAFKIFMVVDTGRSYPHMPGIGLHEHGELYKRMQAVKKTGIPLMIHPHDQSLMDAIEKEYWAKGERDFRAYAKAYAHDDGVIWDTAVALLLRLQAATGVRLHLLHTQTRRVVEMLRAAKAAGQTVTAEVNPWCFWLGNDWSAIERLGSYALSYYVAPHHSDAVYAAFRDGTVDIMATDHAPHLREEKEPGWTDGWKAHTGTPSEQHYLSLLMTDVAAKKLMLERVADATATRPAKLFGLYPKKGTLKVGSDADVVLVDPAKKHTITDAEVLSKCGWTPYAGVSVTGMPRFTFLRGAAIYDDGKIAVRAGYGRQATRVS
jgi:dihydroorotase